MMEKKIIGTKEPITFYSPISDYLHNFYNYFLKKIEMISNPEIADKMKKSTNFQQEMQKADSHYKGLCQQAHYSDLSTIESKLISKYDNHKNNFDIFFFYEIFQEKGSKMILFLIEKIPRYTINYQDPRNRIQSSTSMMEYQKIILMIY